MAAPKDDKYSEEEAQRRFLQSLKGAVTTSPKPLKSLPRKRRKRDLGKVETKPIKAKKTS
jgi:hypothetical protein